MFKEYNEEFWQNLAERPREEILGIIEAQTPALIKQVKRVEWVFRNKLTHLTWDDGSPVLGRDFSNSELARLVDPPFQPIQQLLDYGFDDNQQYQIFVSQDPVMWSKNILGVEPRIYQILALRDSSTRLILRWGRRLGKSMSLAIKILHYAWTTNNGGMLVLAPMQSQVDVIYEQVLDLAGNSDLVQQSIKKSRQNPHTEILFTTNTTARFFTTGMKQGGKCLTPEHEVLTSNGWRSIMNVDVNDTILSWDGQHYVWKPVTNTWSEYYNGTMAKVYGKNLSFFATLNHRFPVWRDDRWEMVEAQLLQEDDEIPIAANQEVADPEFKDTLLDHLESDHIPEETFTLTASSRDEADHLHLCAVLQGRYAKLRPSITGWAIDVSPNGIQTIETGKVKFSYYHGPVFCIEVADTHTFVARHNGTVFITGNSDVVRGQEAELIVLDEMDYMGEDDLVAVYAILMPTQEGQPEKTLVASSTPSGKHGKFREWSTNPVYGFSHWWFPSYSSPTFDKKTEDEMRAEYTENEYRREIEADWGEPEEGVYPKRHLDRAFLTPGWEYIPRRLNEKSAYYIGVDWDKHAAGPNIVVVEVLPENYEQDPRLAGMLRVSFREEINRHQDAPLTVATQRVIELNDLFNPERIMIDRGYGDTQAEQLSQYGVDNPQSKLKHRLTGISFSEKIEMKDPFSREQVKKDVKPYMVGILQHLFEADQIFFPSEDLELYEQLLGYIVLRIGDTGRPVFEGTNSDHAHDALALACLGYAYDHDRLHAKPEIAQRAAYARMAQAEPDPDFAPTQPSRVGPLIASRGRSPHRSGVSRRKREKF